MNIFYKPYWIAFLIILNGVFWHTPFAWGAIIPAEFMLKKWSEKIALLKTLKMYSQITVLETPSTPRILYYEDFILSKDLKKFLSIQKSTDGKPIQCIEKNISAGSPGMQLFVYPVFPDILAVLEKISLTIPIQEPIPPPLNNSNTTPIPLVTELQTLSPMITVVNEPKNPAFLGKEFLARWKVESETAPRLSWVISPKPPKEKGATQVWIEKDEFLLQKIIFFNAGGIQYAIHAKHYQWVKSIPIPIALEVYQQEKKILQIEVLDIQLNEDVPKNIYETQIMTVSCPMGLDQTEKFLQQSSEVSSVMDVFYGVLR